MLLPKTDMITDNILGFIRKENMLRPGDTVVCGLSGGADSVCLLLAMKQLSTQFGITVEALHVNHCLRGDESDRDEAFCRKLCADNGIPFRAFSCNVRAYAAEHSLTRRLPESLDTAFSQIIPPESCLLPPTTPTTISKR